MEQQTTRPDQHESRIDGARLVVAYRKVGRRSVLSSFLRVPEGLNLELEYEEFRQKEGRPETFYMWLAGKGVQQDMALNTEYRQRAQDRKLEKDKEGEVAININPDEIEAEPFLLQ